MLRQFFSAQTSYYVEMKKVLKNVVGRGVVL
jgi:hypothetical protein